MVKNMKTIRHIGIYVENLEQMKNFYCNLLNLTVAFHDIEKSSYIDTILGLCDTEIEIYKLISDDGSMIELLHRKKAEHDEHLEQPVWKCGCMHLAFTVKNVEDMWKAMKEQGYEFISEPCMSPNGSAKVCFVRDPEGNYLELVQEL